jgi:formamidopyrimidine-DNA glycosylase
MPELPDVAVYKQYLDSTALHQEIENLLIEDDRVLDGVSEDKLRDALVGHSFVSTDRYGKNLLVELDTGSWLRLHFGMRGNLKYYAREDHKPEYTPVVFRFTNDYALAYICKRLLGRVSLTESPEAFVSEEGLGPDAYYLDEAEFIELFNNRRGAIKSALISQELIAGIGNVYSDEILYQAGVHPKTPVSSLSRESLSLLYHTMREVFKTAINGRAEPVNFPETYLTRNRDEGQPCPRCDGIIQKIEISGRSGYMCPGCQPEPTEDG